MKRYFFSLLMLFFSLTFAAYATPEKPALGISEAYPVLGQEVEIMVSHATHQLDQFKLQVTYRPNSMVSKTKDIGMASDNGLINWTPQDAGITVITAIANEGTEAEIKIEKQISVRYGQFPATGIFIFILAAVTLFGGLILTASKMGKSGENI